MRQREFERERERTKEKEQQRKPKLPGVVQVGSLKRASYKEVSRGHFEATAWQVVWNIMVTEKAGQAEMDARRPRRGGRFQKGRRQLLGCFLNIAYERAATQVPGRQALMCAG